MITKRLSIEDKKRISDICKAPRMVFIFIPIIGLIVNTFLTIKDWEKYKEFLYEILIVSLFAIIGATLLCYIVCYLTLKIPRLKLDEAYDIKNVEKVFITSSEKKRDKIIMKLTNGLTIDNLDLKIYDLEEITPQTPLEIEYLPKSKYILTIRDL